MKTQTDALHHFHVRKRVFQKKEPFPHTNKWKRVMDKAVYVAGVLGPLMTIPQVSKIWIDKNATGVSLASWVGYTATASVWLIYGLMHKEKPIIVTYILWVILEILVVIGVLIYG